MFTKDANLLKAGKHTENQQHLVIWKFQMECTSRCILDFHNKKDKDFPCALIVGLTKAKAFFKDRSHGIPKDFFIAARGGAASPANE